MQIPCDRTQIHGCVQCSSYAASRKTYMCYFTGSRCSAPDTGSQCTPDDSLCCCGFGHIQHQKTQDAVARTCLCRSHDVSKHLKWMQKARIFYDEWRRKYHLCARSSCWSPDLTCSRRCCSQSYRILEAPGSWLWKKKKRRKLGKVEKTLKEKETLREREAMVNVNHRNWRRPEHLENWQNRAEQLLTSQHQEVQWQHCRFPVGQKGWLSLQKYPAIKTEKVFTATVWKKKLKKSCSQSFVLLKTILEPGSVFPAPTLAAHWRLAPSLQEEGNGEGEWWCGG